MSYTRNSVSGSSWPRRGTEIEEIIEDGKKTNLLPRRTIGSDFRMEKERRKEAEQYLDKTEGAGPTAEETADGDGGEVDDAEYEQGEDAASDGILE